MLRLFVLVLFLANLGFYAWTQGLLDGVVGVRAQGDREPDRLSRQLRPESVRILPPSAQAAPPVATLSSAAPDSAPQCLQAGPYTATQIAAAEGVLQTVLPAGSWVTVKSEAAPEWVVYMGKYPDHATLQKKSDELKHLKISFEELHDAPEFEPGLSLGRFDDRSAAEQTLTELAERGAHSARVVDVTPAGPASSLRVERADATLQSRLSGLRAEALLGKLFTPCPPKP